VRHVRSATLACTAFCTVVLGVAAADFAHVQSRVPPLPPADCGAVAACNDARNAEIDERRREAMALEEQFEARAWLYAFAIIAAIAVAAAVSLRFRRQIDWPRLFTNLGIAGVWSGIGATVILVLTNDQVVSVPSAPAYAPAVVMIAAAAVGTLAARTQDWDETDPVTEARAGAAALGKRALGGLGYRPSFDTVARWLSIGAFAFTGLTVILAIVFIGPQPGCGGSNTGGGPGWTDTVGAIAAITAIGAIASGVGALLLRRWLPSLVSLVVNPFAFLFMVASTCAFY
jgi:DNA-binding transcriptional regulator of glucitol operon